MTSTVFLFLPVSGAKAGNARDYAASSSNDNDYGLPKRTSKRNKSKDKDLGGSSDGELCIVIEDDLPRYRQVLLPRYR